LWIGRSDALLERGGDLRNAILPTTHFG